MKQFYSAQVAQENTEETDRQTTVLHVVQWQEDGKQQCSYIKATCPIEAIQKMRKRHARLEMS